MEKNFIYYPKYIYWELSKHCNLRCKHCFAEAENNINTIVEKDRIFYKIEEMFQKNEFSVRFGGGEPLLVSYLYDLIAFCEKRKIFTAITTNGMLLDEMVVNRLYCSGLKEVTISIDGLKDNHDFLRGKGSYEKIIRIVKSVLKQKKVKVSIAFTVTAHNYNEISLFVDVLFSLGIRKFYFFRYCTNSNAEVLELNPMQLYFATNEIEKVSEKYKGAQFVYEGLSFYPFILLDGKKEIREGCNFLKNIMTIKYNGDVVVCAAIPKVLGNIFLDEIDTLYNKIAIEKEKICKIPTECRKCKYKKECHGGCKSDSYNRYMNYLHKDKACYVCIHNS